MGRKTLLAAAAVLGATYLTSPYLALFRLSRDLQVGDVDAVQAEVDWQSLRTGIRQDVAGELTGIKATGVKITAVAERNALPPFGASFMEGVATHMVDRTVTPEALCAAMHGATALPMLSLAGWGIFTGPASFIAHVAPPGAPPMTLRMRLEGAEWKVTAMHLDEGPQSRT